MRSDLFPFSIFFCFDIFIFFKPTLIWSRHERDQRFSVPVSVEKKLNPVPTPIKKIGPDPDPDKKIGLGPDPDKKNGLSSVRAGTTLPISSLQSEKASL